MGAADGLVGLSNGMGVPGGFVETDFTGGGTTAAEITVQGNAVTITDGDTTPSITDHTDFGSVAQGGAAVSRTFTVRNDGTATLTWGR
jgi:hypothetical protein